MKKLLIISDIHTDKNTLKMILKNNKDVDLKIFCGDLQLKRESLLKNFDIVVKGNCDYYQRPKVIISEIEKVKIMVTHGDLFGSLFRKIDFKKLYQYAKKEGAKLVIYGHDHIKANKVIEGITFFNPGSASFPRDSERGSYGIIEITGDEITKIEHCFV